MIKELVPPEFLARLESTLASSFAGFPAVV